MEGRGPTRDPYGAGGPDVAGEGRLESLQTWAPAEPPAAQHVENGPDFLVADPKETYGRLIPQLVYANTPDFRSHYEYRKVE